MSKEISLTGIKPTGTPHLGNFLGAIRPGLELAARDDVVAYYFIADYHALTTIHDKERLATLSREVAATWIACGLNPEKTVIFRQSDVPEILELAWVLSCFTAKGWMNKAHAYKAQVAKNLEAGREDVDVGINMGLYNYPVLMASDILTFDSAMVPVGKDQVQHIELARDMAERINQTYKAELLVLPKPVVQKEGDVVPGLDGRKMSKSYNNVIPLFEESKKLKKLINKIVTDSTPPDQPKDPDASDVFSLYRAFASAEEVAALRNRFQSGIGWGDAKAELFRVIDAEMAEPRQRYAELMGDRAMLSGLLAEGAKKARKQARMVLNRVRTGIGIAGD